MERLERWFSRVRSFILTHHAILESFSPLPEAGRGEQIFVSGEAESFVSTGAWKGWCGGSPACGVSFRLAKRFLNLYPLSPKRGEGSKSLLAWKLSLLFQLAHGKVGALVLPRTEFHSNSPRDS